MKVFSRTSLPALIKYNGKIYKAGNKTSNSVIVEVLHRNLKSRDNLHGKPYKPTVHYFNPS